MTNQERAAMQQALEALEESIALNKNWVSDSEPEILSYFSEHKAVIEQGEQAITALREALGNSLKPKCFADYQPNHAIDRVCASCPVASECQTGEQPVSQEPVAWMQKGTIEWIKQPRNERNQTQVIVTGVNVFDGQIPLYAAPVRTKDLTDDEAQKLWHDTSSIVPMWAHHLHFARAVIAADRRKNK